MANLFQPTSTGPITAYKPAKKPKPLPAPPDPAQAARAEQQSQAPFAQLWSAYQPQFSAYNANIAGQNQTLNQQLMLGQQGYKNDVNYANQATGFQNQRFGLQSEGQALQQGALNRETNQYLPQSEALANQGFDLQGRQIGESDAAQQRGLTSSATARGSMVSSGTRQGFADINTQTGFANEGLGIQRKQSDLGFQQRKDTNKDQQKNLDMAVKGLGIDKAEFASRAQHALQQLGLQNQLSVNDIAKAYLDINSGKNNPLSQFMGAFNQLAGIRPTA